MAPRAFDSDRIGPFRILYASDGDATSFVAREEGPVGFRRDVVLKIASEGDAEQALAAHDLAEEATLGSRLNHPNIVRTYDFFARDGRLVLVQEHVNGVTLAKLLTALRARQERLSDAAALYIGVAVLEALAHAHALVDPSGARACIVHQRLGPAEIALGKDGAVKLGGFATTPPLPHTEPGATDTAHSAPGEPAATDEGERADVRAAGRLLWELLSGREPTAPLEPLSVVRSDLPRELCAAVGAALDVTAGKRAIGCAEMASWIKKVTRLAGGRDELREKVTALAPPVDLEPPLGETTGESARIPLAGWTVRLAPIANKVLSGPTWSRMEALARAHRRGSLAAVGVVAGATLLFALLRGSSRHAASTVTTPGASSVVAASAPAAHPESLSLAAPPPAAVEPLPSPSAVEPKAVNVGNAAPLAKSGSRSSASDKRQPGAPEEKISTLAAKPQPAPPAPKTAYAIPGGGAPKGAPPPPKGFGYVTVHSSIQYAFVYVQLARYGHVEKRLTIRCGKRFLSLGVPKATGGEPTWFAPSRTVDVPCGSEVEITMMPKWIP